MAGRPLRRRALAAAAIAAAVAFTGAAPAAAATILSLVGRIPLGPVSGTLNDLVMDYAHQRLFVLDGSAGRLTVVDLAAGKVARTLDGLTAPQGIARDPEDDRLYAADGDGKLAVFQGVPLKPMPDLEIGRDLGPIYYDPGSERLYVGYEHRRIAIVDTAHNKHWRDIRLDGPPGRIALETGGSRIFIAAVGQNRILVADRDGSKQIGAWDSGADSDAADLALDEDAGRLLAAFRRPAGLAWFDLADGTMKGRIDACAQPGMLLADAMHGRFYLTCGEGRIEAFGRSGGGYAALGTIATAPGATAALLVPTRGRIYLAVPSANGHPAELRVYAPAG